MRDPQSMTVAVAVAQPMVIPGDVRGNIRRMEPLIRQAAGQGAKLVLFSECALNGYDHHGVGAASALPVDHPLLDRLRGMAVQTDQAIVAGFFEREGDQTFNAAAVIAPDGSLTVQRKCWVTPREVATANVQPGPAQRTIFSLQGLTFAVLICADTGMDGIHAKLASVGCDTLALTAGPGSTEHAFHQHELADPRRLQAYLEATA